MVHIDIFSRVQNRLATTGIQYRYIQVLLLVIFTYFNISKIVQETMYSEAGAPGKNTQSRSRPKTGWLRNPGLGTASVPVAMQCSESGMFYSESG